MDSTYFGRLGYPVFYSRFFNDAPELQNSFLSLPEEAQQAILRRDIHSSEELKNAVSEYYLKR
ncbi:hypothetical protein B6259_05460 [Ruminococcaceae bacterium CPB6]|nr:hypothetical protein B6259_05460 [Ruminococcaceae bacterium CPB6]